MKKFYFCFFSFILLWIVYQNMKSFVHQSSNKLRKCPLAYNSCLSWSEDHFRMKTGSSPIKDSLLSIVLLLNKWMELVKTVLDLDFIQFQDGICIGLFNQNSVWKLPRSICHYALSPNRFRHINHILFWQKTTKLLCIMVDWFAKVRPNFPSGICMKSGHHQIIDKRKFDTVHSIVNIIINCFGLPTAIPIIFS